MCISPSYRRPTKAQRAYLTCQAHSGSTQQIQDARAQRLALCPLSTFALCLTVVWSHQNGCREVKSCLSPLHYPKPNSLGNGAEVWIQLITDFCSDQKCGFVSRSACHSHLSGFTKLSASETQVPQVDNYLFPGLVGLKEIPCKALNRRPGCSK